MQATSIKPNTVSPSVMHPMKQAMLPRFGSDGSDQLDASILDGRNTSTSDSAWGKLISGVIALGATVAILFQFAQMISSFAKGVKSQFAKPINPNDHLPSSDNLAMRNFRELLFKAHPELLEQEMLPIQDFYNFAQQTLQFQPDYLKSADTFLNEYNRVAKHSKQNLLVKDNEHYAPYEGVMLLLDTMQRDEARFLKNKTSPD